MTHILANILLSWEGRIPMNRNLMLEGDCWVVTFQTVCVFSDSLAGKCLSLVLQCFYIGLHLYDKQVIDCMVSFQIE